ncbi:MAG: hypothetical protein REI78_02955 [Pedobacter sp.]|nr:hypothetical protein [Pedobacter sp.]
MPTFKCLYLLENFYLYIIEVKRTDLADDAPASEKFKWLKIDKASNKTTQITFRSMDSSGEIEERYFEEGFLKFNNTIGTFIEKYNSAQHPLERKDIDNLNDQTVEAIESFLNQTEIAD